ISTFFERSVTQIQWALICYDVGIVNRFTPSVSAKETQTLREALFNFHLHRVVIAICPVCRASDSGKSWERPSGSDRTEIAAFNLSSAGKHCLVQVPTVWKVVA